jgi:uncharacterized protein YjiS (DUF1127 family)
LNQWVGEILTMLGTSWRPVVGQRGRDTLARGPVNPVSQRYLSPDASGAGRETPGGWRLLFLQARRAVESWLRHASQRQALNKLDEQLLRDIGLAPDSPSLDEERRACSVPFRLPRQ